MCACLCMREGVQGEGGWSDSEGVCVYEREDLGEKATLYVCWGVGSDSGVCVFLCVCVCVCLGGGGAN